jgi:hypothetical protein
MICITCTLFFRSLPFLCQWAQHSRHLQTICPWLLRLPNHIQRNRRWGHLPAALKHLRAGSLTQACRKCQAAAMRAIPLGTPLRYPTVGYWLVKEQKIRSKTLRTKSLLGSDSHKYMWDNPYLSLITFVHLHQSSKTYSLRLQVALKVQMSTKTHTNFESKIQFIVPIGPHLNT